jgi:hypothetical protein
MPPRVVRNRALVPQFGSLRMSLPPVPTRVLVPALRAASVERVPALPRVVAAREIVRLSRNVELKPRDPMPERSLQMCALIGAEDLGEIWQRDTYFDVPGGRLKPREERPGQPHLIHYTRADQPQERESSYRIAAPQPLAGRSPGARRALAGRSPASRGRSLTPGANPGAISSHPSGRSGPAR